MHMTPILSDAVPMTATSQRIQRLAFWGQVVCGLALALIVGSYVAAFLSSPMRDQLLFGGLMVNGSPPIALSEAARQHILVVMAPAILCQSIAIYFAFTLFRGYRTGDIFSSAAGRRMVRLGWALLAAAPLGVLMKSDLASMLASDGRKTGNTFSMMFSPSDFDFGSIGFGILAIIIGRVLSEAATLSEDHRAFV
jgi:hypothetical protein